MTPACLLPTVHVEITPSLVWAFFVALSLIVIECMILARSNPSPRVQKRFAPCVRHPASKTPLRNYLSR